MYIWGPSNSGSCLHWHLHQCLPRMPIAIDPVPDPCPPRTANCLPHLSLSKPLILGLTIIVATVLTHDFYMVRSAAIAAADSMMLLCPAKLRSNTLTAPYLGMCAHLSLVPPDS